MKKIYAAACVVVCCMGNPAAAYIPGCNFSGDTEAYNLCIQMQDELRQQQWELEEIQRELESSDYL